MRPNRADGQTTNRADGQIELMVKPQRAGGKRPVELSWELRGDADARRFDHAPLQPMDAAL